VALRLTPNARVAITKDSQGMNSTVDEIVGAGALQWGRSVATVASNLRPESEWSLSHRRSLNRCGSGLSSRPSGPHPLPVLTVPAMCGAHLHFEAVRTCSIAVAAAWTAGAAIVDPQADSA